MGLVNMLFRKSGKSDDIGGHAAKLVLDFLGTTSQVEATPFTFTEMFAFVYFEIVNVVFNRKTSIGPSVVESLSKAYCETMDKEFRLSQNEMHLAMLNTRIQEYGTMLNSQKEV